MMSEKFDVKPLVKRLDAIINLLFEAMEREGKKWKLRERIVLLHSVGLQPVEIAKILNTSSNYIRKELSVARKSLKVVKEDHGRRDI